MKSECACVELHNLFKSLSQEAEGSLFMNQNMLAWSSTAWAGVFCKNSRTLSMTRECACLELGHESLARVRGLSMKPDCDTLNSATWSCLFAFFRKSGTSLVLVDPAEDILCCCGKSDQVVGGVCDVYVCPVGKSRCSAGMAKWNFSNQFSATGPGMPAAISATWPSTDVATGPGNREFYKSHCGPFSP